MDNKNLNDLFDGISLNENSNILHDMDTMTVMQGIGEACQSMEVRVYNVSYCL